MANTHQVLEGVKEYTRDLIGVAFRDVAVDAADRAEAQAERAEAAADNAEVGIRDDTVAKNHLTSGLRGEIDGKVDESWVDDRLANSTKSGGALLPMVPGTNTPMWAASFRKVTVDVPPGEKVAYSNNLDGSELPMKWDQGWVQVSPHQRYKIRVWLKADTPDSDLVLWSYGDTDTRGIDGGTIGISPTYPAWVRNVPTEWTLYEGFFQIQDGVTALRIGSVTWNHGGGGNTSAVQYISGLEIWPDYADADHTHTAAQVGARPDTWTPTAQDVGARPADWVPTAAQVGARPDTWTPTAAQVGAATPAYVDSRIQEVTADQWPSNPQPGVIYWQAED